MKDELRPTISELLWLFVFGCFLGFILETIWYFIKHGHFINKQGLLYGPFKPIYGIGLVLIVLFMYKYRHSHFGFKYILGVIIGSLFEYIGSIFQEYVFHTSTWNYSTFNYNIAGRLYLPYCLAWGIIAVLCIDFLYPNFKKLTKKIPNKSKKVLTMIIAIFMSINISLTVLATIRYSGRANDVQKTNTVFKVIDKIYNDEYMQKKFPKLKIIEKNKD